MRVIPVIDLLDRLVVRGVAGNRATYQPVKSRLVRSAAPGDVAQAFVSQFQFDEIYVADLDAIAGRRSDHEAVAAIVAAGAKVILDAGVSDPMKADELVSYGRAPGSLSGIVVGLESVTSPALLVEISNMIPPAQRVFSMDMKAGALLVESPDWAGWAPGEVIAAAVGAGFERLIVLDLADVGTERGTSTLPLCDQVRRAFPTIELIAGGGVRGLDDLNRLAEAGCDAALVASALHDGSLTARDLPRSSVRG